MVARTQLGAAGTQFEIFDFFTPEKVLYASWGVAVGGRPGVCHHLAPDQNSSEITSPLGPKRPNLIKNGTLLGSHATRIQRYKTETPYRARSIS